MDRGCPGRSGLKRVNKLDGTPFDDERRFCFIERDGDRFDRAAQRQPADGRTQGRDSRNAGHRQAMKFTSTLNLERMCADHRERPQAVIPYERAAIALNSAAGSS